MRIGEKLNPPVTHQLCTPSPGKEEISGEFAIIGRYSTVGQTVKQTDTATWAQSAARHLNGKFPAPDSPGRPLPANFFWQEPVDTASCQYFGRAVAFHQDGLEKAIASVKTPRCVNGGANLRYNVRDERFLWNSPGVLYLPPDLPDLNRHGLTFIFARNDC